MDDWLQDEIDALDLQLERGEIDRDTHWREVLALKHDAQAAEARQSTVDAGRGHLVK